MIIYDFDFSNNCIFGWMLVKQPVALLEHQSFYVLTLFSTMSILINIIFLVMSILFCTFVSRKQGAFPSCTLK